MKIAMIGHKRVPSREGGVERVVEELSTRLVAEGNIVDVYNRKGNNVQDKNADKEVKNIKKYKGVNIKTIPTINKKGIDALLYSFFATIVALFGRYDVIHYHAEGPCAMLWIPHMFGIKTVATIHGLDWQRSKWGGFATKYIKFGEKVAAKYADEIIVLSRGVQKYFKDTYNRDTTFIPNGVNKPEIKDANIIKEKWNLEKDSYVLFLARIVPEKGLHYLINAFKQIDTDKKLVIAGGASHTNDYLEEIKNMVKDDDRIIMTGFVQGEELEELYSNCYIYCLPSDIEGMPISLLEAMSYGCNCLVSDIEENVQVTENYAETFEKGNTENLKSKLESIINRNERKNTVEEISNHVLQKYDWKKTTEETKKLYNKKISKKNKIISLSVLIITIIVIILNYVLNPKQVNLMNYTYAYSLITLLFFIKNNCKIELNVSLLMIGFYTLMIGICPIIGVINNGTYYENQYFLILLSYIAMIIGYSYIDKNNKKIVNKDNKSTFNKGMKIIAFILLALSILGAIYYGYKNRMILFGNDLENGRITAMSGNGILLQTIKLSIISGAILFEQYMRKNMKLISIVIVSIIIIVINLLTGFRSGILTYIIITLLIYNKFRKINIKKMIFILIPIFILLLIIGSLRGGILSSNNNSFIKSSLTTLQAGSINLNWILNKFPSRIEFQHGYTYLINIIMLKPGPDLDFTLWLKEALGVSFNGGGVTPTIIGEFYLNFGYIGTYIGMFCFGIIIGILEKMYKNNNYVGLQAFIITMITGSFRGGLANIEINTIIGVTAYITFIYISKLYMKIENKKET